MNQANTYEEIKPLIELCKAGKLFAVQEWIAAGKPVNLPSIKEKTRRKSPLEIAIECGFHSLVQVLLEGGAAVEEPRYNPLLHALWKRRLDFVDLLVAHGAQIQSVRMDEVFDTWDRGIIDFFINQGADLEKDEPLAAALCSRIRPALGIYYSGI
jgi:ankyrin repeat protein